MKTKQPTYKLLAAKLADLISTSDKSPETIIRIFAAVDAKPSELCDAFWLLDNEPGRFYQRDQWHPYLRQVRNSPKFGEQLFALFRG